MNDQRHKGDGKAILLLSGTAGIIGGLCCLTPIVLVMFGLTTVSAAASLGNVLYGDYRWVFRGLALVCLIAGLVFYFRKSGVCTLDAARRARNRIINVSLLALIAATGAYVFWTYVILHYWGIVSGLPWAQYDESWAIPVSAALLGAGTLAWIWIRHRPVKR